MAVWQAISIMNTVKLTSNKPRCARMLVAVAEASVFTTSLSLTKACANIPVMIVSRDRMAVILALRRSDGSAVCIVIRLVLRGLTASSVFATFFCRDHEASIRLLRLKLKNVSGLTRERRADRVERREAYRARLT